MKKRGAHSKYEIQVEPYLNTIRAKVKQGVIEKEIAKSLGISVATLNNYKHKHQELKEALNKDKGAEVLQSLINAGVEAAKGYYKNIETTVIILDEDGKPSKRQKTITKQWFPPNPSLNQFYTKNYGKEEGFTGDPLEYEFKKAQADLENKLKQEKDWFK